MPDSEPTTLIFNTSPEVTFATNTFIDVPVILQYDDEPLIEVAQVVEAGYSTKFRIYNDSGDKLAAIEGAQMYKTEAGERSGLKVVHEQLKTVCVLGDQTLFEIERVGAAGLRTAAELYAPDGRFVVAHDVPGLALFEGRGGLQVGSLKMIGNKIQGFAVGIHVQSDGSIGIGVNRP